MDPLSLQPSNRQFLSSTMLQSNFFPGQSITTIADITGEKVYQYV
jgi:hypothetical protein